MQFDGFKILFPQIGEVRTDIIGVVSVIGMIFLMNVIFLGMYFILLCPIHCMVTIEINIQKNIESSKENHWKSGMVRST